MPSIPPIMIPVIEKRINLLVNGIIPKTERMDDLSVIVLLILNAVKTNPRNATIIKKESLWINAAKTDIPAKARMACNNRLVFPLFILKKSNHTKHNPDRFQKPVRVNGNE
ncbi:hypothetical protein ES705_30348 [subsurface metagenome]